MKRKIISLLIVFSLCVAYLNINIVNVYASIINSTYTATIGSQTIPFADYPVGSYFTDNGSACNDHTSCGAGSWRNDTCNCKSTWNGIALNSTSCYGFANMVFYRLFGHTTYSQTTKVVSNISASTITSSYLYNLFTNGTVKAGAHIRNSTHSMIFMGCDSSYIYTYEGNYDSHCRVGVIRRTWSEMVTYLQSKNGIAFIQMPNSYPNAYTEAPSNAWVDSNYDVASSYDNITLSWGADSATTYWMHIYKDGQDFINQSVGNTTSYTRTYPEGNYTAYIEASNSVGSTLVYACFSVTNQNPDKVIVYSDRKVYGISESVTLYWNNVNNANSYLLHIWTSKEDFLCQEVSGTSFTLNNLKDEMYTVYVTTYNTNGSTTSDPYDFWVTSSTPDMVNVTSTKDTYNVGETVTLTWNTVNNANSYLLHIWTSKEDFLCEEVSGNVYTLSDLEEEMYTVYVTTYNTNGSTTSTPYDFWVGKYDIMYDTNYDNNEYWMQSKIYNKDVSLITDIPVRDKYIFVCWNTKADGRGVSYNPGDTYTENKNLVLYAQWEELIPYTESTVTKSGTKLIIDTKVHNITTPYDILIVGYKNNKFVTMKKVPHDEQNSPYTLEGDIDEIKVIVWDGLSTIKPLCYAEEIPSSKWIIE